MRRIFTVFGLVAISLSTALLSGCSSGSGGLGSFLGAVATTAKNTAANMYIQGADLSLMSVPSDAMSQIKNGTIPPQLDLNHGMPGLVVCSPVVVDGSSTLHSFGDGCGSWLELQCAGEPALGSSPSWSTLTKLQIELGKPNLELTQSDLSGLYRATGTSYAALGQITEHGGSCQLTYSVYALQSGKLVGQPITISGNEQQVMTNLPKIAAKILSAASVNRTLSLMNLPASPDDMAFLADVRWNNDPYDENIDTKRLASIAHHDPLSAIVAYTPVVKYGTPTQFKAAQSLIAMAPGNAEIVNSAAEDMDQPDARSCLDQVVTKLCNDHPRSYLFQDARKVVERVTHNASSEIDAAMTAVIDAPRLPEAWTSLAGSLCTYADRSGNSSEVKVLYSYWLGCDEQSLKLDPQYKHGWVECSKSALKVGFYDEADTAIRCALHISPSTQEANDYAFQLYTQIPGISSEQRRALAKLIENDPTTTIPELYLYATTEGDRTDKDVAVSAAILQLALKRDSDVIAANPKDADAHIYLANIYINMGDTDDAIDEYGKASSLAPSNPDNFALKGHLEFDQGNWSAVISDYQKALALAPDFPDANLMLGQAYQRIGRITDAIAATKREVAMDPQDALAWSNLGNLYLTPDNAKEAVDAYSHSLKIDPANESAWERLVQRLDMLKQYPLGLTTARAALDYYPDDPDIYTTVADIYLNENQPDHVIEISQVIADHCQVPVYIALAHANMGDAYNEKHDITDALAQWSASLPGLDEHDAAPIRAKINKYSAPYIHSAPNVS